VTDEPEARKPEPMTHADWLAWLVEKLNELTDEERLDVFARYCTYCGRKDPDCQCWNDE
jgi:hypothetical protein